MAGKSSKAAAEIRKWLLRFHLYGGLFFCGFLVVFAFSALCFHHHPAFMDARTSSRWTQPIAAPPAVDPWARAAAIRAELGVTGKILHPAAAKAAGGEAALDFVVARPGRRYTVHAGGASARVDEERLGWVGTLAQLHGVRPNTNSLLLNAWAWYTALGAVMLMASAMTGLIVWVMRHRAEPLGWTVLGGAALALAALCVSLRMWG